MGTLPIVLNRRSFLALVGGAGIVAATDAAQPANAQEAGLIVERKKFFDDGRVRPFAGNTIICPLPRHGPAAAAFKAMHDIYGDTSTLDFMRNATMLPPASYHVTIFDGINDADRRSALWSGGIPADLAIPDCNHLLAERLKTFQLGANLPISLKVDLSVPDPDGSAIKIHLLPFDETETIKLRTLRDRLSDCLEVRRPNHESYGFHISLAYWIKAPSSTEWADFLSIRRKWHEHVSIKCPLIELGAPEYCTYENIFSFKRQFYLS